MRVTCEIPSNLDGIFDGMVQFQRFFEDGDPITKKKKGLRATL